MCVQPLPDSSQTFTGSLPIYTVILREYVQASVGYSITQDHKLQPLFAFEQIRSVSRRNPMLHFPVQLSRKPGSSTF